MNIIVDIGNTRVKVALFQEEELVELEYMDYDEIDSIRRIISKFSPEKAIISSVTDLEVDVKKIFAEAGMDILTFNRNTKLPINIEYDSKSSPGLDRIADSVSAFVFSKSVNKLIIDIGTCITYNYVLDNIFVGGAISPGINIRYKALNTFTDRLPLIHERRSVELIGSSTKKSIQSGVINGIIMELQGICDAFVERYNSTEIFLTGGDSIFFAEGLKNTIFADPYLTLKGLNKILAFNES